MILVRCCFVYVVSFHFILSRVEYDIFCEGGIAEGDRYQLTFLNSGIAWSKSLAPTCVTCRCWGTYHHPSHSLPLLHFDDQSHHSRKCPYTNSIAVIDHSRNRIKVKSRLVYLNFHLGVWTLGFACCLPILHDVITPLFAPLISVSERLRFFASRGRDIFRLPLRGGGNAESQSSALTNNYCWNPKFCLPLPPSPLCRK